MSRPLETADFDYQLPAELIAQSPLERRDDSRLMVLDRVTGTIHHSLFNKLSDWLAPGDLIVANNSRVIPARLHGNRVPSGGAVEILLLRKLDAGSWSALGKPAKRLKRGDRMEFPSRVSGMAPAKVTVEQNLGDGELLLRFEEGADERLDLYGEAPVPPYITRALDDAARYQTVYATVPGSAAAPTAGMHFTDAMIEDLAAKRLPLGRGHPPCGTRYVSTRHRGAHHRTMPCIESGAKFRFRPRKRSRPAASDEVESSPSGRRWHGRWKRWVEIGVTRTRAGFAGFTDTFIVPGHRWKLVDGLLTNFHLPRSTLLMLVSALAGREAILEAYAEAARNRYRFYSFGDAMLIL